MLGPGLTVGVLLLDARAAKADTGDGCVDLKHLSQSLWADLPSRPLDLKSFLRTAPLDADPTSCETSAEDEGQLHEQYAGSICHVGFACSPSSLMKFSKRSILVMVELIFSISARACRALHSNTVPKGAHKAMLCRLLMQKVWHSATRAVALTMAMCQYKCSRIRSKCLLRNSLSKQSHSDCIAP